ncbi:MAG: hypothetical protein K6B72_05785 [Lachnospiraceae bacterium]|nr:hypothetical protein [Lachnospiraceae bacterium]
MFELTHLNYATIIIDGGAILLVWGILWQTRFMRSSGRPSDRLFFGMLLLTIVMAVADIVAYLAEYHADALMKNVQLLSNTTYFMAITIFEMSWLDYCHFRFRDGEEIRKIGLKPEFIPGILMIGLLFINQTTGYFFYIDEMGIYRDGILGKVITIGLFAYFIPGVIDIAKYRTADKKLLIPVWIYIMPVVVAAVSCVLDDISMVTMGFAVTIAFTHLGTMSEIAEYNSKESVL